MNQVQEQTEIANNDQQSGNLLYERGVGLGFPKDPNSSKRINLGDCKPEPSDREVDVIKKYILLNYDGNMVQSADMKGELHASMMDDAAESKSYGGSGEYVYSIVKAGELEYYWSDDYGWMVDKVASKCLSYVAWPSTYRRLV